MKFTQLANNILKSHIQESDFLKSNISYAVEGHKQNIADKLQSLITSIHIYSKNSENEEIKTIGAQLAGSASDSQSGLLQKYRDLVLPTPPSKPITTDQVTGGGKYSAD